MDENTLVQMSNIYKVPQESVKKARKWAATTSFAGAVRRQTAAQLRMNGVFAVRLIYVRKNIEADAEAPLLARQRCQLDWTR